MKLKRNNGITLIALVITIIILLILAGISISGLFGTNGLITKAKEAALEQKKEQYFEEINLEILDEQTERFGQLKEEAFIKSLQTRIQNKKWVSGVLMCDDTFEEKEKIEENTILIIETKEGYEIIIDVDNSGLTAQIRENYFEKNIKKCEVKYDSNGGNGKVESQEIRKGFSAILKEGTLTKNGYEFVGWSKDKEGAGEIYAVGSKLKIEEETTLYAIWEKNTATITFKANGGTGEMLPITVTKRKETKLPENTYTQEGYSFAKWTTNQDGTGTEYTNGANITINEDTILYAMWEVQTYTITYNANGGSGEPNSQTKKYGEKITLSSTIPTRKNFMFLGWSTSNNATSSSYDSGAEYSKNANLTLYAVWYDFPYESFTITSARGSAVNTWNGAVKDDVTEVAKASLLDGIKTKQGGYGAWLGAYGNFAHGIDFVVPSDGKYITFCSNFYSDMGGQSGHIAKFYKLNMNTNEYDSYIDVTQQNNNPSYSKTYFPAGFYKMTISGGYVEFDEWIVTDN